MGRTNSNWNLQKRESSSFGELANPVTPYSKVSSPMEPIRAATHWRAEQAPLWFRKEGKRFGVSNAKQSMRMHTSSVQRKYSKRQQHSIGSKSSTSIKTHDSTMKKFQRVCVGNSAHMGSKSLE